MERKLERILLSVQNPSRYIGGETGTPTIDENSRVKFCVLSPELYEVGMTDMKLKSIYHKVNDRKSSSAERVFAPWLDMASAIKKAGIKLFSLESKRAIDEFDVIGASLKMPSEFTTLLYMLELGGIPAAASQRSENHPLVFGFGDGVVNAEVVSAFLDFVILGDAEEVILSVLDSIKSAKTNKFSRSQVLFELSKIGGVYVPSVMQPKIGKDGKISGWTTNTVKKVIAMDLDRAYLPSVIQVSNTSTVKECAVAEPIRGCTRGCRFCMYGFVSRPVRERRVSVLSSVLNSQVTSTGAREILFGSRCFGDYSKLGALMNEINNIADEKKARVLIPNFEGSENYSDFVRLVGKDMIELSVEAGTETMRNKINKLISDEKLEDVVVKIYKAGYRNIKINFMIGLPFETGNDLMGIVECVKKIKKLYRRHKTSGKPVYITCQISNFVPKPFTPFAWCESISVAESEKRFGFIKKMLRGIGVRVKLYSPEYSCVESILSRGDRKVSEAIIQAYRFGAVFDKNAKLFNFDAYKKAFNFCGIDIQSEMARRDASSIQPWEGADMFVEKSYLISEYEKAKKGSVTPDCRNGCKSCGLNAKGGCSHGNL